MKRGFTLVELSIVLVVIGLLIGGVLVAQSMIETSKIQAQVRQFQQFDAAVANFITKYNQIPGDSPIFGCNDDYTGYCGNGMIEDHDVGSYGQAGVYYFREEIAQFWSHLSQGVNFTQNGVSYTPTITTSFAISGSAPNSPQAAIEPNTGVIAGTSWAIFGAPAKIQWYQLANYNAIVSSATNLTANSVASITPIQALAIDQKMDDGLPNSGMVNAQSYNNGGYFGWSSATSSCVSGAKYLSNNAKTCGLTVQIMSQSGGLPGRGSAY